MSTSLTVIRPNPLQKCHRCGTCCEYVGIPHSPRKLREMYDRDHQFIHERGTDSHDIRVIYPMLKGRCRGKHVWSPDDPKKRHEHFFYGPCANLEYQEVDGRRVAGCTLHGSPAKPAMCRGYPFYSLSFIEDNPVSVMGCGYNLDPLAGRSTQFTDEHMWKLDDDDLEIEEIAAIDAAPSQLVVK